ncbi:ABC transporter permease [Novosphingobium sp.]|uniref:ABC transporter permease n=1 Tax=Novosphingobium sp. TaxID=1874826 RepID=UPI0025F63C2E|nr:ABC transporter permease [Novosphingobium sp.]
MNTTPSSPPQRLATGEPATAAIAAPGEVTFILEAGRADRNYWADLWRFRELFAILAWRDVAVQYKQTVIGIAWALVRPLLTTLIFTGLFSRIARLPSEGDTPYPLMVMAGMLPWFLFSTILTSASGSLTSNSNLISKVYFPRLIVPAASAAVAMVDFMITLVILFALMATYSFAPSWHLIALPLFIVFVILAALGPAFMMAALSVSYRDFRFIVPFFVQFGLYVSPVGFSSKVVPESWRTIYALNPMVGIIDGFRWCLLGGNAQLDFVNLAIGLAVTLAFLWLGIRTFRATEKTFADLV